MLLRVHTNDGRTEDIHLDDDAKITDLRRAIADAFVVVSGAERARIRIHEPFHERLRRRLKHKPQPSQSDVIVLDDARASTALAALGVRHQSTIVVENCDEISSRAFYSVIRRLRSLKESDGGGRRGKAALDLVRTLMRDRILNPDRISVPVDAVKPVLEGADCYAILSPLGVVLKGDRFFLDNVTSCIARQVLYCLYGRQEWGRIESEQQKAIQIAVSAPPPKLTPTPTTKPKPVTDTMPDYSQRAFYMFVAVIVAGIVLAQCARRYSERSNSGFAPDGVAIRDSPRPVDQESTDQAAVSPAIKIPVDSLHNET